MPNRTLTLEDPESGLSFAVSFDRWDGDRAQWHYKVSALGEILAEGTDLRSGASSVPCEARALGDLLCFLSAFAESIAYERTGAESENGSLFPASMRPAAEIIGSDGFAMLAESVEVER